MHKSILVVVDISYLVIQLPTYNLVKKAKKLNSRKAIGNEHLKWDHIIFSK